MKAEWKGDIGIMTVTCETNQSMLGTPNKRHLNKTQLEDAMMSSRA